MPKLLLKKEREALVRIISKKDLKKQNIKKKNNYVKKAHAFIIRNLNTLLKTTLQNL